MIIKVTKQQFRTRLKNRAPEYLSEISPAIVKTYVDGSMDFETEHPSWVAAMAKYRPVREAEKRKPCEGEVKMKMVEERQKEKERMNKICKECGKYKSKNECFSVLLRIKHWKCGTPRPVCPDGKF